MARPLALHAEIFGGLHDAGSEVHLPKPVDGDARQQRIARIDHPFGKAEPIIGSARGKRRQDRRHARFHFLSGRVVGAANQHEGVPAGWPLGHHHYGGEAALEFFPLQLECAKPFPGVPNFRRGGVLQGIPAKL